MRRALKAGLESLNRNPGKRALPRPLPSHRDRPSSLDFPILDAWVVSKMCGRYPTRRLHFPINKQKRESRAFVSS